MWTLKSTENYDMNKGVRWCWRVKNKNLEGVGWRRIRLFEHCSKEEGINAVA